MYIYSPWQTLYDEEENGFEKYNISNKIYYISIQNTFFGKCLIWNGVNISDLNEEVYSYLKKNKIIGIINALPNYYNESEEMDLYLENSFKLEYKWATYLLNIDNTIEDIKKNMSNSLKRNIKKLEKRKYYLKDIGVSENVFNDFLNIYNEARLRANLSVNHSLKTDLTQIKYSKNRKYFVLYIDNIPMACQGICYNENVAIEVILAISDYAHNNKIYAGDLLKWKIIEWCKEKNIKIYDFAGVAPYPKNEKESGIKAYKEKWGGKYVEYGVYSKSLSMKFRIYMLIKYLMKVIKCRIE